MSDLGATGGTRGKDVLRWLALVVLVFVAVAGLSRRSEGPGGPAPVPLASGGGGTANTNSNLPFPVLTDGSFRVGFDRLGGFELQVNVLTNAEGLLYHDPAPVTDRIPPEILALDGRRVTLDGFMQPVALSEGRITEFLLMRDRATCCFGGTPEIHHWMPVTTKAGLSWAKLGEPVRVNGTLTVKEMRSQGVLVGIYSLHADSVEQTSEPAGVTQ